MSFLKRDEVPNYNDLAGIFKEQEELMHLYQPISRPNLPNWPIDLGNRDNQKILKGFMADCIEEVGEFYEHVVETLHMLVSNDVRKESNAAIKQVEMNEELADCIHFFTEVCIFCSISPNTIAEYIFNTLKNNNVGDKFFNHPIEDMNILEATLFLAQLSNKEEFDHTPSSILLDKNNRYGYNGCKYLSPKMIPMISKLAWYFTYNITKAMGTLKNKAWKQTDVETNGKKLQDSLIAAYIDLMRLLKYMNYTPEDICLIYHRKNQENQFRIRSKY